MNKKLLTIVLAGTFFTMALLPAASMAGNGRSGGQGLHKQTKSAAQTQGGKQLRDGYCLTSGITGAAQQKGKNYGPGNCTGNQSVGPKDGTGYGATAKK